MEISLVIPAYNEEESIAHSIKSAKHADNGSLKEIIVVDNGSTDRTAEIAGSFEGVTVVREDRKGTGHARQTGAEHAHGEIIACIDADSEIPNGWFEFIERTFQDPKVVFLSGAYRYHNTTRYPAWLLTAVWLITPLVNFFVGYMGNTGNCAIRASALRQIGGFDRDIKFYGDDTDLSRRLHKVGKTVWTLRFYNYSSPRRFEQAGLLRTCWTYMLNYWWPVLFHKPFTPGHHFIEAHKTAQTAKENVSV